MNTFEFFGKIIRNRKILSFSISQVLIICLVLSVNYLNVALDLFNTNLVSPVHYVLFNAFIILASAILFKVSN